MLKVVVLDSGWGGEMVADYIEGELAILDVIRVIDWRGAPYMGKTRMEILQRVEKLLRPYLGRVQAVVLAGFMPSLVVDALRRRHPGTKFVDFNLNKLRITGVPVKKVMILADSRLKETAEYKELRWRAWLYTTEIMEPDCDRWRRMIDEGEMTPEYLRRELRPYLQGERVDVLMVANTHFWDIRRELIRILRWQVRVVDYRQGMLRELCKALRLRGIDGRRVNRG